LKRNNSLTVLLPFKGENSYIFEAISSIFYTDTLDIKLCLIYHDENYEFLEKLKLFCKKYNNVSFIKVDKSGLAHALNTGILNSSTELIARLDSDDLVIPGRFEKQIEYLNNYKNVAVVGSQVEYIDQNGQHKGFSRYPVGIEEVRDGFLLGSQVAHPSVMLRKSAIIKIGNYSEYYSENKTSIVEDLYLWMRVLDLFEIANIDEPLTKYRQHEGQVSNSNQLVINELTLRIIGLKMLANVMNQSFVKINEDFNNIKNMQLFIRIKPQITHVNGVSIQRYRRSLLVWSAKNALASLKKLRMFKFYLSLKIICFWCYPI
jgi:glycosyltransferase involved in cell wall biosynthesis